VLPLYFWQAAKKRAFSIDKRAVPEKKSCGSYCLISVFTIAGASRRNKTLMKIEMTILMGKRAFVSYVDNEIGDRSVGWVFLHP
jgi:hypothetical protein